MKILKNIFLFIFVIVLLTIASFYFYFQSLKPLIAPSSESTFLFQVERMSDQPIIHIDLHPRLKEEAQKKGYIYINGSSLIRVLD